MPPATAATGITTAGKCIGRKIPCYGIYRTREFFDQASGKRSGKTQGAFLHSQVQSGVPAAVGIFCDAVNPIALRDVRKGERVNTGAGILHGGERAGIDLLRSVVRESDGSVLHLGRYIQRGNRLFGGPVLCTGQNRSILLGLKRLGPPGEPLRDAVRGSPASGQEQQGQGTQNNQAFPRSLLSTRRTRTASTTQSTRAAACTRK